MTTDPKPYFADIATATDNARCQIDFLQEYRTRLTADMVTDKLNVRQAIARLRLA